MDHEKVPGLAGAEREAVAAYRDAHFLHASVVMEEVFGDEAEERLRRAVERIEEAHARLSESPNSWRLTERLRDRRDRFRQNLPPRA